MNAIPQQRQPGRAVCKKCDEPIHLANRQLGAEWTHDESGSAWCSLVAEPAEVSA